MIDRRMLLGGGLVLAAPRIAKALPVPVDPIGALLAALERRSGGRLGVAILDTANGRRHGWRGEERFAHCSSFKLSLAAMLLAQGDAGVIDLGEVLRWQPSDLLAHSPATTAAIDTGLSVRALARATLVLSDNAAANVLLRRFGGPGELTRFWRRLGDRDSRLDRYEPALNDRPPGSPLDTTTPLAMAGTVAALVEGQVLAPDSRRTLREWMTAVDTGRRRLRAGFPQGWVSGDKTGTGLGQQYHSYVDLAFGGPAGRRPRIVAAYYEPAQRGDSIDPQAEAVLAAVGQIASRMV